LVANAFVLPFHNKLNPVGVDIVSAASANVEESAATKTAATKTTVNKSTSTVSKPPVVKQPVAASNNNEYYIVVKGDTMWKIAKKVKLTLKQLISLNPQIINPSKIFPGNKINIKTKAAVAPSTTVTKPSTIPVSTQPQKQEPVNVNVTRYEDGTYRGVFVDGGKQQVGVEFKLKNNVVTDISFRTLLYGNTDYRAEKTDPKILAYTEQYNELISYLKGKDIRSALEELYKPSTIVSDKTIGVDSLTGATLRSGKVVSAINDGLNRGVYSYAVDVVPGAGSTSTQYQDGAYRGVFIDGGKQQVGLEFKLNNNIVTDISFRTLVYKDVDYRAEKTDAKIIAYREQYVELISYLKGKDIRTALVNLYKPAAIAADKTVGVDTLAGATLRSGKVISSIRDGLNRGAYSYSADSTPAARSTSMKHQDGTYRGVFVDGGNQQVGVEFKLNNNIVTDIKFRTLVYRDVDYRAEKTDAKIIAYTEQYVELINYLKGKDIRTALVNLYKPATIAADKTVGVDTLTGATLRSGKVISSITDALNRGLYSK
jgi:spore coat assembly protein SafA